MGASEPFHSGFVALVGRPNAGKSTLANACVGFHVAITSKVAQTTRRRLRAVVRRPHAQIVLCDTPGIHKPKDRLGNALNRQALGELDDVDVVCHLLDATRPFGRGDAWVCEALSACHAKRLLVVTKADIATSEQIGAQIDAARARVDYDDAIALSAKDGFNVEGFLSLVASWLPEGPAWFGDEMDWDGTDEELVADLVRERVLRSTRDEVPHATAVRCDEIRYARDGHASVRVTVLVDRESQKAILIGRGGSKIKAIGTEARHSIERLLGTRVYLDIQVRVRPHWRDDEGALRTLGYDGGERG